MQTAFGRAMLATVNGQPQKFRMTIQGGHAMNMAMFLTAHNMD